MSALHHQLLETPVGWLHFTGSSEGLHALRFLDSAPDLPVAETPLLLAARRQLQAYFDGELTAFDLPLLPAGTPFQRRVWAALAAIPFGRTRSYGDIATALGDPKSVRAVGLANGRNPLPIVLPCHRVIGKDGRLIGYGGGLWRKEWLLRHEGVLLA